MGTEAEQPLTPREFALLKQMGEMQALILKLEEKIARLERDSDNSNSPPSSDPPFKTRKGSGKTGKPGAKFGHKAHQRTPFPPERVDEKKAHDFPEGQTPAHLRPVEGKGAWMTFRQITRLKAVVTEHQVRCYRDTRTGKIELAPHPKGLGKLLGPEACAAVAWLKTKGHMAVVPMRDFFRDILDAKISAGCLMQAVTEAGRAAKGAWEEVRAALKSERVVGFDETSHWDLGWRCLWMWVAQTPRLSLFRIGDTRSADELDELLPVGWSGIMIRDRYAAYARWTKDKPGIRSGLCMAHMARDIKSLLCHPCQCVQHWAKILLDRLGGVWDAHHLEHPTLMQLAWQYFMRAVKTPTHGGAHAAETLAKGIVKNEAGYALFMVDREVPPTNNASERALRPVVIHRKITQGTRGMPGMDAQERLWTLLDTARKQGTCALAYLCRAVQALRQGEPAPAFLGA